MDKIKLIKEEILEKVQKDEEKVIVTAIFAKEISFDQREKLIKKLEKKYNKKIILEVQVNNDIIGGGILKIGNNIIDGSIKNQLEKLKRMF